MESCWHNFTKFSSLLVQNLTSCQLWNKGESVLFRICLPNNNLTDDCWVFSRVLTCCSVCVQQPFWRAWRCTLPCTSGHSLKCVCGWLLILSEMVLTHLMMDTRENLTLPKRVGDSSPDNCKGHSPDFRSYWWKHLCHLPAWKGGFFNPASESGCHPEVQERVTEHLSLTS